MTKLDKLSKTHWRYILRFVDFSVHERSESNLPNAVLKGKRLILTHGYLVVVVFTGKHLHTSGLQLRHLLHCREQDTEKQ